MNAASNLRAARLLATPLIGREVGDVTAVTAVVMTNGIRVRRTLWVDSADLPSLVSGCLVAVNGDTIVATADDAKLALAEAGR